MSQSVGLETPEVSAGVAAVMKEFNLPSQAAEPAAAAKPAAAVENQDPEHKPDAEKDSSDKKQALAAARLDDEQEYEIDGKVLKGKELRKGFMLQSDYTRKTQELAKLRETTTRLQSWLNDIKSNSEVKNIVRAVTEKILYSQNPDAGKSLAQRLMATLEGKEQDIKPEANQQFLADLPDDDPYAQSIKHLHAMMQKIEKSLENKSSAAPHKMQDLFDDVQSDSQSQNIDSEHLEQMENVKKTMNTTLEGMVKELGIDADDVDDWRSRVLYAANKSFPREFENEQQFVDALRQVGKAEYDRQVKRDEKIRDRYIKSKAAALPGGQVPSGAGADEQPKKLTMDTFEEIFSKELKSAVAEREAREKRR